MSARTVWQGDLYIAILGILGGLIFGMTIGQLNPIFAFLSVGLVVIGAMFLTHYVIGGNS